MMASQRPMLRSIRPRARSSLRPLPWDGFGDSEHRVADDAERIAQLVTNGRGQLAQRRQSFLAQKLFLYSMELGRAFLDATLQFDSRPRLLR